MAHYIDADKIYAEIERLESENNCGTSDFIEAKRIAYNQVKRVLDSLPEQPASESSEKIGQLNVLPKSARYSEGLEEATEEQAKKYAEEQKPKDADGEIWRVGDVMVENQMSYEDDFIAGAEWQKARMLEVAVEGTVVELGETYKDLSLSVSAKELNQVLLPLGLEDGDKVKIIIVKEDK